jgi:hypothetical protein
MDQDFYLPSVWLSDPVNDEMLQAVLADLEQISQNDIQARSQIDNDSINNDSINNDSINSTMMILDLDKQKNEESIPLENVAEEEERREILVETINEEEQRAFEHAGDVSDIAHRKLSPQKSLAQEKANGKSITIIYIECVLRYVTYMLGVYIYMYIHNSYKIYS